jgi:hypothetical protein
MHVKLSEKNKPHCLIVFRHGGFFFSQAARATMLNGALVPSDPSLASSTTLAEVLQL